MLLVVSSASRLANRYGPAGWLSLQTAIREMGVRLAALGDEVLVAFPDDADSMAEAGVAPMGLGSPGTVRFAIDRLRPIEPGLSLLLVGGDEVIPFWRLPNPVTNRTLDPDVDVLSDNPYGCTSLDPMTLLAPVAAVTRLPDFDPPDLKAFLEVIRAVGRPPKTPRSGVLGIVNADWEELAWRVLEGTAPSLRATPSWNASDPEWAAQRSALLYFNMHGFTDKAAWQGFNDDTGEWVEGLRPDQVTEAAVSDAVVLAENCYGARTIGLSSSNSVCLAFVRAGARAFVGSTGLAFGSRIEQHRPEYADKLAEGILDGLGRGEGAARALQAARVNVSSLIATTYAQKTALEFVVYGDPSETL